MEEFMPILMMLAFFFLFIWGPSRAIKNVTKKGTQTKRENREASAPPAETPAPLVEEAPARPEPLRPTISISAHDDSLYQGSLNAVTGEGYDPCHDEQLQPLTDETRRGIAAAETEAPGLQLSWTGSEIVRGFVMGEILRRRR